MKIISLNVNNFGGINSKPRPDEYKESDGTIIWNSFNSDVEQWQDVNKNFILYNLEKITQLIKNYEVVILQEVDTNCISFEELNQECIKNNFEIVFPNGYNKKVFQKGHNSITCMLIKKYIKYEINKNNFSNKKYKNVDINIGNVRILGVHIPKGDLDYWNALINEVKNCTTDKLLVMGDLNVYDCGTKQKAKYLELLRDHNMIDSWTAMGNEMDRATCNTGKIIDYALVNPELANCIYNAQIIDTPRNYGYTDHSAIVVSY